MILVAVGMFIAYIVTFLLMPFIIRVARINKLYDKPDERKTHTYSISSLGGVGMIAGLSISVLLVSDFSIGDSVFQYYLASFFIIFMLGVIDDLFILHPLKKLAGQLLVSLIVTTKAHLLITNLQGLGGFYELNATASYLITFFAILLIINSFNLIDGVDGLAGSLGLVSSVFFGLLFYLKGDMGYAILGFAMAGTLMAFLVFNFPPARIFMGDSGSMLIGLVNAIFVVKVIELGNSTSGLLSIGSPLALAFAIVIIPVLDVLRVFIVRLTKGSSPFTPDRNHIHHLLLSKGFNHTQVTITMLLAGIILALSGYLINNLNVNLGVVILTALFFSGVFVIKFFTRAKPLHVVGEKRRSSDAKVLTLYADETDSAKLNQKKSAAENIALTAPKTKAE